MKIAIDYYIKQEGLATRVLHTSLTESDIIELLEKKFQQEELACPTVFDREKCKVEFVVESVTV
jgi:hypothetical protein